MKHPLLCLVLALAQVVTGCITVDSREDSIVRHEDIWTHEEHDLAASTIAVSYIIQKEAPPKDHPGLDALRDAGIVPAYISVTNTGSVPVKIRENHFALKDDLGLLRVIPAADLPRTFRSFNVEALFANIANVSLIVVGTVLLIAAAAKGGGGSCCWSGGGWGSGDHDNADSKQSDYKVINPLQKVTAVTYEDLLLTDTLLLPGETREGLMFFRDKKRQPRWQSLTLRIARDHH